MHLTSAEIDPKPRLTFSGKPEDLEKLATGRVPVARGSAVAALWQRGIGTLVQISGAAARGKGQLEVRL